MADSLSGSSPLKHARTHTPTLTAHPAPSTAICRTPSHKFRRDQEACHSVHIYVFNTEEKNKKAIKPYTAFLQVKPQTQCVPNPIPRATHKELVQFHKFGWKGFSSPCLFPLLFCCFKNSSGLFAVLLMSVWFYAWLDVYRQARSPFNTDYPDLYIHAQSHKHKAQSPPLEAMLESCLFAEALHCIKYVYSKPQIRVRGQTAAFSDAGKEKKKKGRKAK